MHVHLADIPSVLKDEVVAIRGVIVTIPDKNNSMVEITGAVRAVMHDFFRWVFGIISGGPSSIENAFLVHLELIARSSNSDANRSLIESKLHLINIVRL